MKNSGRMGREFAPDTQKKLRERVAFMCSYPYCRRLTVRMKAGTDDSVVLGEAAHICGAAPGSARFDNAMSASECKSFANGIWLCTFCARMIDKEWRKFPTEVVRRWKDDAEIYVEGLTTQDTRLRQLRSLATSALSSLRILTALPGPGPATDQTFRGDGGLPLWRAFLEGEQLLFENSFLKEADIVRAIAHDLGHLIQPACSRIPPGSFLDITEWKDKRVRTLMIDVMQFTGESYSRYLETERELVQGYKANHCRGAAILSL